MSAAALYARHHRELFPAAATSPATTALTGGHARSPSALPARPSSCLLRTRLLGVGRPSGRPSSRTQPMGPPSSGLERHCSRPSRARQRWQTWNRAEPPRPRPHECAAPIADVTASHGRRSASPARIFVHNIQIQGFLLRSLPPINSSNVSLSTTSLDLPDAADLFAPPVDNASRKRESNGSVLHDSRSKIPRMQSELRGIRSTAGNTLIPPQLRGRSNVVTEDMSKLFVAKRKD